jgi:hypothetical protein
MARGLAILAMVLQVSTIMLYGQGQAISQTRDAKTGLLTMVICSPVGLKQITIDANGNVVDEKIPSDNRIECPFSAAIASNNLLSPVLTVINVPRVGRFYTHPFSSTTKRLAEISLLAIPGRGPPSTHHI